MLDSSANGRSFRVELPVFNRDDMAESLRSDSPLGNAPPEGLRATFQFPLSFEPSLRSMLAGAFFVVLRIVASVPPPTAVTPNFS